MKSPITKILLLVLCFFAYLPIAQAVERTPPIPTKAPDPVTGIFTASTDDFVSLIVRIDEDGHVIMARVRTSSDKRLEKCSLVAVRNWQYIPATRDGLPVKATIIQPIHFGSGRLSSIDKKAIPTYAPLPKVDEKLADINAEVSVAVSIDSAGFVTKINPVFVSDERLRLPVLDAIREWNYEPARRKNRAVSSRQIQTFVFGDGLSPSIRKPGAPIVAVTGMSINPVIQRGVKSLDLAQLEESDD